MDQFKQILLLLKKQHFWILCGILVIAAPGAWRLAVGDLAVRYVEREGKLTAERKAVQEVARETDPPNQSVIEVLNATHEALKKEVFRAWQALYQIQKRHTVWPKELGEEFIAAAEALKPGAHYLVPGEDFKGTMYLEAYRDLIKDYLPKLGLIIDVREKRSERRERLGGVKKVERRTFTSRSVGKDDEKNDEQNKTTIDAAAEDGGIASDVAEGNPEEIIGKVYWDRSNEDAFRRQFEWQGWPSTTEILVAQENIWIYEALLRIIRDTNADTESYYNLPVKRIFNLDIGREAAGSLSAGSRTGRPGTPGAAAPTRAEQQAVGAAALSGRYVDQNHQPLASGAAPPMLHFKMMPVRMVLQVDERRIPRLLAQCANSSMPIEVTRVLLSPDRVERGKEVAGAGGRTDAASSGTAAAEQPRPWDIKVEIQGIIYIFNPPDPRKFGLDEKALAAAPAGAAKEAAAPKQ